MASTTFVDGETLIEAAWLNDVNAVVYTPGTSTAADIANVPAGNIAATDVQTALNELDTEKAKLGANSDITSLSGLTTALSVAQGGTGQTTLAAGIQSFLDSIGTTQGTVLYNNGTDWVALAPGTSGQFLKTLGAAANPAWGDAPALSAGTAVSASGTAVNFTGIPAGTKRVTVMFSGVSASGTNALMVQLGHSGGVVTTGYSSYATQTTSSTVGGVAETGGILLNFSSVAANTLHGLITIANLGANTWVASGCLAYTDRIETIGSSVNLGAQLDRIRLTSVGGTDSFDAGTINILYE